MATDGPTPDPCDKEIFRNGRSVMALDGASNAVERWVKKVAAESGARMDWHYSGGRANVLFLGDEGVRSKIIEAAGRLVGELDGDILCYFNPGEGLYRADPDEAKG